MSAPVHETDGTELPAVCVLAGGYSLERTVSLNSGAQMRDALQEVGFTAELIDVGRDLQTKVEPFDVAMFATHGGAGEDGTLQALLEVWGMPYVGPSPAAFEIAANKPIAKAVFRSAGLRTPEWRTLSKSAVLDFGARDVARSISSTMGLPVVVKPAVGGSSMGVSRVDDPAQLGDAIGQAMAYADVVVIEAFVEGIEVTVPVADGVALPAIEIEALGRPYDFEARYTPGLTRFHCPPRMDDGLLEAATEAGLAALAALGGTALGRADLIVDADGTPWLLEVAFNPGMTETSAWPASADASGTPMGEHLAAVVRKAYARRR